MISHQELFVYMAVSFAFGAFASGMMAWIRQDWVLIEDWIETRKENIKALFKKEK